MLYIGCLAKSLYFQASAKSVRVEAANVKRAHTGGLFHRDSCHPQMVHARHWKATSAKINICQCSLLIVEDSHTLSKCSHNRLHFTWKCHKILPKRVILVRVRRKQNFKRFVFVLFAVVRAVCEHPRYTFFHMRNISCENSTAAHLRQNEMLTSACMCEKLSNRWWIKEAIEILAKCFDLLSNFHLSIKESFVNLWWKSYTHHATLKE